MMKVDHGTAKAKHPMRTGKVASRIKFTIRSMVGPQFGIRVVCLANRVGHQCSTRTCLVAQGTRNVVWHMKAFACSVCEKIVKVLDMQSLLRVLHLMAEKCMVGGITGNFPYFPKCNEFSFRVTIYDSNNIVRNLKAKPAMVQARIGTALSFPCPEPLKPGVSSGF